MNKKIILVLTLFSLSLIPVSGESYTGYIEPFNNASRIQKLDKLIHNGTKIGFNMSLENIPKYENLTAYTVYSQNPINEIITVFNDTYVYAKDYNNYDSYLCYNFTNTPIENFTLDFDFYWLGSGGSGNKYSGIMLSNYGMMTYSVVMAKSDETVIGFFYAGDSSQNLDLRFEAKAEGGSEWLTAYFNENEYKEKWVYMRIIKNGTDVRYLGYNYTDRTGLLFSYNDTLSKNVSYDYFYAVVGSDVTGFYYIETYKKNIKGLENQGEIEGFFFSKDLLSGIESNATAILYYTEIEDENSIYFEFSEDNLTWTRGDYVSREYEGTRLDDLNYSSLYMRGNFTRPSGAGVCDLKQLTLIYEGGEGGEPAVSQNYMIIFLIVGVLFGYGAYKGGLGVE